MKILIIVESPAKAKTIQKILSNISTDKEYIVKSSFGHIRNLCCKTHNSLGVDVNNNYKPNYVRISARSKQVNELLSISKTSDKVILAADEDREGEAIAWHLCKVLKLDEKTTDRIVFHEITKSAIEEALKKPRTVNMNMVRAQQARQIVDKLVGFEISPILCSNIRNSLSAGRVQSVCMKMIIEREENIDKFQSKITYKTNGIMYSTDSSKFKINCTLNKAYENIEETKEFLNHCIKAKYTIRSILKETKTKKPYSPFTTSSLQQEVGKRFGLPAKKIMAIAQSLYESGHITYHRTDSLNLSDQVIKSIKDYILSNFTDKYYKGRRYKASSKGAQEAHEAIRPTKIERDTIQTGDKNEEKVYEMIWKRTVASQMSEMVYDEFKMLIDISNREEEEFTSKGEEVLFDGFKKVYNYDTPKDTISANTELFKQLKSGDILEYHKIISTETHSKAQGRYSEPTLIKKMETYGIGRPSTYASTMATIQDRGYVAKKTTKGREINCKILTLETDTITENTKKTKLEVEKNKLFPTDTGKLVNSYLTEHFNNIMEYNFTADFEKELDKVFTGDTQWTQTIDKYYKSFHPKVAELKKSSPLTKSTKSKRYVGIDKESKEKMYVYVAKFGPVIQIGEDGTSPRYVGLDDKIDLETLTEEEANKYTAFPRKVGEHKEKDIIVKKGRYGYYISYNNQNYKIKEGMNEHLKLEEAVSCIEGTVLTKVLKQFNKTSAIKSGQYGPYIQIGKKFVSLPKKYSSEEEIDKLTLTICKEIVDAKSKTPSKKKYVKK